MKHIIISALSLTLGTAIPLGPGEVIQVQDQLHKRLSELTFSRDMTNASLRTITVTASAYSASKAECNATPEITADGTPSRIGLLAISRDLESELGLQLGETVLLPGLGVFKIHDRMSTHKHKGTAKCKPIRRSVDILHVSHKAARLFTPRTTELIYIR